MATKGIQRKAERANRSFEEEKEWIERAIPSHHITSPKDVANTIAFLLTDAATNIVGESVKISGGSVLR